MDNQARDDFDRMNPIEPPHMRRVFGPAAEMAARAAEPAPPAPVPRKFATADTDAERKAAPIWDGAVRYFPSALLEVAKHSLISNEQHNPGQPMHWAQHKSTDQCNTAARHLLDADAVEGEPEEILHLRAAAWRVLARLQMACQRHGAPIAPAARTPETKTAA